MVGQRWDTDVIEPGYSRRTTGDKFRSLAHQRNSQRSPIWIDYFVFTRGLDHKKIRRLLLVRPGGILGDLVCKFFWDTGMNASPERNGDPSEPRLLVSPAGKPVAWDLMNRRRKTSGYWEAGSSITAPIVPKILTADG